MEKNPLVLIVALMLIGWNVQSVTLIIVGLVTMIVGKIVVVVLTLFLMFHVMFVMVKGDGGCVCTKML